MASTGRVVPGVVSSSDVDNPAGQAVHRVSQTATLNSEKGGYRLLTVVSVEEKWKRRTRLMYASTVL